MSSNVLFPTRDWSDQLCSNMEFNLKFAIFNIECETRGNSFRFSRVIPGYGLQKDTKFVKLSQIKNLFQVDKWQACSQDVLLESRNIFCRHFFSP